MNIETINMINNTSYLAKSNYYFIRVLKDYVEPEVTPFYYDYLY